MVTKLFKEVETFSCFDNIITVADRPFAVSILSDVYHVLLIHVIMGFEEFIKLFVSHNIIPSLLLEVVFGFELVEDFGGCEGDRDVGISVRVVGVIEDVSDMLVIGCEGFEDVVVIIEIEVNGVSQCFSP